MKPSINTAKYAIYYPHITSLFSEYQADDLRLYQCIVASVSGSCRTRASVGIINSRNFVNIGLFEFLNSHDTPPEQTVFQEPPQEKIWYS